MNIKESKTRVVQENEHKITLRREIIGPTRTIRVEMTAGFRSACEDMLNIKCDAARSVLKAEAQDSAWIDRCNMLKSKAKEYHEKALQIRIERSNERKSKASKSKAVSSHVHNVSSCDCSPKSYNVSVTRSKASYSVVNGVVEFSCSEERLYA